MILAGAIERQQMGLVFSCASFFHISILSVKSKLRTVYAPLAAAEMASNYLD
jgi:hypothetical protein